MVKLSTAKVFVHTLSRCLQCLSTIGKNAFVDNFTTKALSIPALMMNRESCRDRPGVRPRFSSFKEFIIQHASAIEEVTMRIHRMIDRDASCFEHHYLGIYEGFSSQSGL